MQVPHELRQTPNTLRLILADASDDELSWQPRPDRWSISMVLAHLADVEEAGFMSRFQDILGQDDPLLRYYDQLALFRERKDFDGRAELDVFERLRTKNLVWLEAAPEGAARRTGRHEQLGHISFEELLNEFAFHDLGHLRQVIELYRCHKFYPKMGAFQSYYNINP